MDVQITRRRLLGAGLTGFSAFTLAQARVFGHSVGDLAGNSDDEILVAASFAGGTLRLLTLRDQQGFVLTMPSPPVLGSEFGILDLQRMPLGDAFFASGFTQQGGLVGALLSRREYSFSCDLNYVLPERLAHLAERMPTRGEVTNVEQLASPASTIGLNPDSAKVLTPLQGPFGWLVAGDDSAGRYLAVRSSADESAGSVVTAALIHDGEIKSEVSLDHFEAVIAAHVDDRAAVLAIGDDSGSTTRIIDIGREGTAREFLAPDLSAPAYFAVWGEDLVMVGNHRRAGPSLWIREAPDSWSYTPSDTLADRSIVVPLTGKERSYVRSDGTTLAVEKG